MIDNGVPGTTDANAVVFFPLPVVVVIENDCDPVKANVPSPPSVCFSTVTDACRLLVNVHATVSPAATSIVAVLPDVVELFVGSVQTIPLDCHPAGTDSVIV